MKNNFALRYSAKFYDDLDKILDYIIYELKNSIASENLLNNIEKAIYSRSLNPLGYEKYRTKSNRIYYRIYIRNFIIFYTVYKKVMVVRRIIYNKRNLKRLI